MSHAQKHSNATRRDNLKILPDQSVQRLLDGEHPLRIWRKFRGLSIGKLARLIGATTEIINAIESDKQAYAMEMLEALSAALCRRVRRPNYPKTPSSS